jgi:hypothetical protein
MKKLLFATLLTTGLVLGASAQDDIKEKDVPSPVQTSFKSEFPNAKDVEWKLKDGTYKVKFEVGSVDQIASFDASGKRLSKGIKIRISELPAAISSAVKTAYADRTIDEAYTLEKDGATQYMVKLNGSPETKLVYSADGQLVKEKKAQ